MQQESLLSFLSNSNSDSTFLSESSTSNNNSTPSRALSRRQLLDQATALARNFKTQNQRKQQHGQAHPLVVLLFSRNSVDVIIALVAAWILRWRPLLVSWSLPNEAVAAMVKEQQPRHAQEEQVFLWLGDEGYAERASAIQAVVPAAVILSAAAAASKGGSNEDMDETVPLVYTANDIAVILHTSGTTSTPRCIPLTHRNIIANQRFSGPNLQRFVLNYAPSSLLTLPLFHGFGLLSQFIWHLCDSTMTSCCTILVDEASSSAFTAKQIISAAISSNANTLCCVPSVFEQIAAELFTPLLSHEKSSVRVIVVGGCSLSLTALEQAKQLRHQLGIVTVGLLGMTETAGSLMFSSTSNDDDDLNALQLADGFVDFAKFDESTGELLISQACPALSSVTVNDDSSFFHTRDVYHNHVVNPDANEKNSSHRLLRHVGRLDDTFKLATGKSVNPVLVESILLRALHELSAVSASSFSVLVLREPDGLFIVAVFENFVTHQAQQQQQLEFLASLAAKANSKLGAIGEQCLIADPAAQIVVLPPGVAFPRTAKGSIIRSKAAELCQPFISARQQQQEKQQPTPSENKQISRATLLSIVSRCLRPGEQNKQQNSTTMAMATATAQDTSISVALLKSKLDREILANSRNGDDDADFVTVRWPKLVELLVLMQQQQQQEKDAGDLTDLTPKIAALWIDNSSNSDADQKQQQEQEQQREDRIHLDRDSAVRYVTEQLLPLISDPERRDLVVSQLQRNDASISSNAPIIISSLATAFLRRVPFQSLSMISTPLAQRKMPTFAEIRRLVEGGRGNFQQHVVGGQCFVLNVYFGALLSALGFSVFFGRCSIHGVEDCHVAVFLRSVYEEGDLCQIEVGCGYVMPNVMRLSSPSSSSQSATSSTIIRQGPGMLVKYERHSNGSSYYSLWMLPLHGRQDQSANVEQLWEQQQQQQDRASLFWSTRAVEMPVISAACDSPQTAAYLGYSKLRVSRCLANDGSFVYLKANVASTAATRTYEDCIVIRVTADGGWQENNGETAKEELMVELKKLL